MKTKPTSYLYNFYTKDDGRGVPVIIFIDGFRVQIGVNVAILPGFHIKPKKERSGQLTVIGSNSFLGKNTSLEEGSTSPEGTILQGEPLFRENIGIKILVVADDLGRTPENNRAIIEAFQKGFLHHASLMVNRNENTREAVNLTNLQNPSMPVGLHLNFTEGVPLSPLSNEDWYSVNRKKSFGSIINSRRAAFFLTSKEKRLLKNEAEVQIKQFKEYGFDPKYIDSHGNNHFKWPVAKTIYPILKKAGFKFIRIPRKVGSRHLLYDWLFKNRVIRLYRKHFSTVDEFMSASDLFSSSLYAHKNKTIEIMVHPYMRNQKAINRRDISFDVLLAYFNSCGIMLLRA